MQQSHADGQHQNGTASEAIDGEFLDEILGGFNAAGFSDTSYLKQVVESDVGMDYLSFMQKEVARANVLANRNEAEVWEAWWLIHFRTNAYFYEHPPQTSKMTGTFRELVYGEKKQALEPEEVREILALEAALKARVTQSRDMEQQRVIKEMRQERTLSRDDTGGSRSLSDRVQRALR